MTVPIHPIDRPRQTLSATSRHISLAGLADRVVSKHYYNGLEPIPIALTDCVGAQTCQVSET